MAGIVQGTYRTERRAGLVADFCPVCRGIERFEVIRIGDASHVAFVSVGEGRLAGHMIRCGRCQTGRAFHRQRYAHIARESSTLEALIELTHPNIRAEFAERLELEARLQADPSV